MCLDLAPSINLRSAKDACNIADPMLATCFKLIVYGLDNELLYRCITLESDHFGMLIEYS